MSAELADLRHTCLVATGNWPHAQKRWKVAQLEKQQEKKKKEKEGIPHSTFSCSVLTTLLVFPLSLIYTCFQNCTTPT